MKIVIELAAQKLELDYMDAHKVYRELQQLFAPTVSIPSSWPAQTWIGDPPGIVTTTTLRPETSTNPQPNYT